MSSIFWDAKESFILCYLRKQWISLLFGVTTARDQLGILFTPQRTLLNKNHFEAGVSAWLKLKRGAEAAGAMPRS